MVQIKKDKFLNIIGLMSGTSLDGIDVSLVKSNGKELLSSKKNYYFKYKNNVTEVLKRVLENYKNILGNEDLKNKLDNFITHLHLKAIIQSGFLNKSDYIGFHGQTIFHEPKVKSIQLGNPQMLANLLKKIVVFDFRSNDIFNNGQGAPLAPIYHKMIIQKNKIILPSCFLNIGGISNISYWDGKSLIGFDTGPGNNLMDNYIQLMTNNKFDLNGEIASKGKVNKTLLKKFLSNKYFQKPFPKSLDKYFFNNEFNSFKKIDIKLTDAMSTLAEITISSIVDSFKLFPKFPKSMIIAGGGYKNKYLINRLKEKINISFYDLNEFNHDPDFIESELIAFLAARTIRKTPITFPKTTGVKKPLNGGKVFNPIL